MVCDTVVLYNEHGCILRITPVMTSNGDEHKSQCANINTELTGSITRIRISRYCVCVKYVVAATLINWAVCRGNSLKTSLNLNVLAAVPYMTRESNIFSLQI